MQAVQYGTHPQWYRNSEGYHARGRNKTLWKEKDQDKRTATRRDTDMFSFQSPIWPTLKYL